MDVVCNRCGGAFPQSEVDGRFQGTCPKCLANALLAESTADPTAHGGHEPIEPGRTIGGYEVVEPIGAGGMGVVYKARQAHLDRFVALKVLPRHLADQPDFEERFRREAKALASLSHANIVGVHDFGIADGVSYLVMEYVDGVNLRSILREKRLTPEEAIRIVPQLCDALEYAHGEGIVHRDIKPENILIDKKGRVKVADFGLAKIVGGEATQLRSITRTDVVMGTPSYMAPEQLEDSKRVDHRADIYSMGVVFYEMLTGELPLGSFAPPSQKVQVDVRLDEVVLKTLAKEPERRYQHASEVKEDVTQMTRLAPPSRTFVAPRRSPLRRVAWIVALAALSVTGFLAYRAFGPAGSRVAEAPAWFERIVMSDDDLPGLYEFQSPGRAFAAGPLRATTPDDVNLVLEALQKAGVGWRTPPRFRQAALVLMNPLKMGYAALVADSEEQARTFHATLTPPSGLDGWTRQDGTGVLIAFGPVDGLQNQVAWRQMVNWLSGRMGLSLPFALQTAPSVLLEEDDLPMGCSVVKRYDRIDREGFAGFAFWPLARFDPKECSAASLYAIEPGHIFVAGLEIPRAFVRRGLVNELQGATSPSGRKADVMVLWYGPLVVVTTWGAGWSPEGEEVSGRVNARLGGTEPRADWRRSELARVSSIDLGTARSLVATPTPARPEDLDSPFLTAVVLSGMASADMEWAPGATPGTLLDHLERHALPSGASILSPPFIESVSEETVDVNVPGCVRLSVGFGMVRGNVAEFRLPKSGLRIFSTYSGWTLARGSSTGNEYANTHSANFRDAISWAAHTGGANIVIPPEVQGTYDRGTFGGRWQEKLSELFEGRPAWAVYEANGILRFGERKRIARLKASLAAPAVVPTAPSPRVSVDVWETDFRRTALRIAQSGGVSIEFSPDVKGKVTARLVDVPWRDALEALATTCDFDLSETPAKGLLLSVAGGPPRTPLEPLFFDQGDVPSDWVLRGAMGGGSGPAWGVSDHEIDCTLSNGTGLKGISAKEVSEVWRTEMLQNQAVKVTFLLMLFRSDSKAQEVEASLETESPSLGRTQVLLRRGPILAVALLVREDAANPFDALIAKLRERMGLEGK